MCHVQVIDVRPGVDGDYIALDAVEHIYSRQGYITWLDVRTNPYAGASSNVLHGYLAKQIAQLPLTAYRLRRYAGAGCRARAAAVAAGAA